MAETQTTRLSRKWLLKMSIFLIGLPLFGLLGLYDGLIKYPNRGARDASYRLSQFLDTRPITTRIDAPAETLQDLEGRLDEASQRGRPLSDEDVTRLEFLRSLDRLWRLDTETLVLPIKDADGEAKVWDVRRGEAFAIENGQPKYDLVGHTRTELKSYWDTAKKPTPLDSKFDIAFQWILVVVCFGLWPWPLWVVAKAARTRYRWDAAEQRLTLPDGSSFTPADIADLDKSKWHKFYVTIHLNDGRAVTLDLLRFEPLEDWFKQMERTRYPEAAAAEERSPSPDEDGEAGDGDGQVAQEAVADEPERS